MIELIGQMWWNPRNGFNRDTALFGVALAPYVALLRYALPSFTNSLTIDHILLVCREVLLGAEVRLYSDNPDNTGEWAEARVLTLGAGKHNLTEGTLLTPRRTLMMFEVVAWCRRFRLSS